MVSEQINRTMILLFDSQQSATAIAEILSCEWDGCNAITLKKLDEAVLDRALGMVASRLEKPIDYCHEEDCYFIRSHINNLLNSLYDRESIDLWEAIRIDEDPRETTGPIKVTCDRLLGQSSNPYANIPAQSIRQAI